MEEEKWPWQEEDPKEYAHHMIEQTEGIKDEIGKLINDIVDSTPEATWSDDQAPYASGADSSFLNCRTEALYKLREAYDLLEKGLRNYEIRLD